MMLGAATSFYSERSMSKATEPGSRIIIAAIVRWKLLMMTYISSPILLCFGHVVADINHSTTVISLIKVVGIDKGAPSDVFKLLAIQVVTMENDAALVRLEHDASPGDELYIPKKELMEIVLDKEMASSAHLSLWCTYLHRMLVDQGNLVLYGFIDPMFIQGDVLLASEDPVTTICDILARDDRQFYFAPYLNKMNVVVFFCSIGNKSANELKTIIEISINANHMLHGERRRAIRWIIHSSCIQRGSWECGYYVMKWMFEIISSRITER